MIGSKTIALSFALATVVVFGACGENGGDTLKREISEEAGDIVNAVAPEDAKRPAPTAPPAATSVEETMTAVEGAGGLTRLPAAAATAAIDQWIQTLNGNLLVDDSDLLVENLLALREELSRSSVDGERVATLLDRLARETRQAGDDADDDSVKALAKVLEEAAEGLE